MISIRQTTVTKETSSWFGLRCEGCGRKTVIGDRIEIHEDTEKFIPKNRFTVIHTRCTTAGVRRQVDRLLAQHRRTGSIL